MSTALLCRIVDGPAAGRFVALRKRLRLSRQKFADRFGLDVRALQEWEPGRRVPDRVARVLLIVIDWPPRPWTGRSARVAPTKPGVVPRLLEEHATCMAARRPCRRLQVSGDPDGDPLGGFPDRAAVEMRIARGRLGLAVTEQAADDRQALAKRERPRGVAVSPILKHRDIGMIRRRGAGIHGGAVSPRRARGGEFTRRGPGGRRRQRETHNLRDVSWNGRMGSRE